MRDLRAKMRDVKQLLAELITEYEETKYKSNYDAKAAAAIQQRRQAAISTIGTSFTDNIKPSEDEQESKYYRALNMCTHYKKAIKLTKHQLEDLM